MAADSRVSITSATTSDVTPLRLLFVSKRAAYTSVVSATFSIDKDVETVATVSTIEKAVEAATTLRPDVTLIDAATDGSSPFDWRDALGRIRAVRPETRVVLIMATIDFESLAVAGLAGARAVVCEARGVDGIKRAIHSTTTGVYIEGQLAPGAEHPVPNVAKAEDASITHREREVLELLGQGFDAQAIARALVVSIHTVRWHIKNLLAKLGARTQLEAVVTATRLGILKRTS